MVVLKDCERASDIAKDIDMSTGLHFFLDEDCSPVVDPLGRVEAVSFLLKKVDLDHLASVYNMDFIDYSRI